MVGLCLNRAGKEFYNMAVSLRGFYLKVGVRGALLAWLPCCACTFNS